MTRETLCKLDGLGGLQLPEGALARSDLNEDDHDDFILALCRLSCAGAAVTVARSCDQTLIFLSNPSGYQSLKMPGELLDIRHIAGGSVKLLSSAVTNQEACPVEDGVCNPLYEIRDGELIQAGIE